MNIRSISINIPNRFLIIAILLFGAIVIYLFNFSAAKSFIVDVNKVHFEELKREADDLKSQYDSLLIFNTKLGIVRIYKTDTIIALEHRKDILISELEEDRSNSKIKTIDLVKLKKIIEELRTQELLAYNSFNDELRISADTSEFTQLASSTNNLEKQIGKTNSDIQSLLNKKLTIAILHFRPIDKNGKENYQHEKVKMIKLDCYIQGCLLKVEPIFLILMDPSGKIIPLDNKSKLITLNGKKEFPSISDLLQAKGNYSKTIPASLGLPGSYEIIILDSQDRNLAQKTIELL